MSKQHIMSWGAHLNKKEIELGPAFISLCFLTTDRRCSNILQCYSYAFLTSMGVSLTLYSKRIISFESGNMHAHLSMCYVCRKSKPLKGMLPTEPPHSSSDCFLIIAMSTGANKEN